MENIFLEKLAEMSKSEKVAYGAGIAGAAGSRVAGQAATDTNERVAGSIGRIHARFNEKLSRGDIDGSIHVGKKLERAALLGARSVAKIRKVALAAGVGSLAATAAGAYQTSKRKKLYKSAEMSGKEKTAYGLGLAGSVAGSVGEVAAAHAGYKAAKKTTEHLSRMIGRQSDSFMAGDMAKANRADRHIDKLFKVRDEIIAKNRKIGRISSLAGIGSAAAGFGTGAYMTYQRKKHEKHNSTE